MFSRTMNHPDYINIVVGSNGRTIAVYGPSGNRPDVYRTWAEVLAVLPLHRPWAIAADYAPAWADYIPRPIDPYVLLHR